MTTVAETFGKEHITLEQRNILGTLQLLNGKKDTHLLRACSAWKTAQESRKKGDRKEYNHYMRVYGQRMLTFAEFEYRETEKKEQAAGAMMAQHTLRQESSRDFDPEQ